MSLSAACRVAVLLILSCIGPARAETCEAPEILVDAEADLPAARARVAAGKPLAVLIVTSAKPGLATQRPAFPTRLPAEIGRAARARGLEVAVEAAVLNLPGETAPEALAPMLRAVAERHPALVVWQTGTADAIVNLDPETFGTALKEGFAAIRRLGADPLAMDMQYSPHTAQLIDFLPYLDYLAWEARTSGTLHFPRHALMRYWVETGRVDFGDGGLLAKEAAYDFVHRCLARRLGEEIAERLAGPPQAE